MTMQVAGGGKLAEIIRVHAGIACAGLALAQVMDAVTTRAQGMLRATGAVLEPADGEEMAADMEMYRQQRLRQAS